MMGLWWCGPFTRRRRDMTLPHLTRILVAVAMIVAATDACSSDPSAVATGCRTAHHDPLDPASSIHVLPGAVEPHYHEDPPTSGAHQAAVVSQFRGVVAAPISRPQQVGLLEKGRVLIQAQSSLDPLRPLTSDPLVTVAPAPALPVPVAATAWQWSMSCTTAGPAAIRSLQAFIRAHENHGPEPAPPS